MFYCMVDFQIEEDHPGRILIEANTRVGCVGKMAEFVRNCLGGPDGGDENYRGFHGIMRCLADAEKLGYIVCMGRAKFNVPDGYFKERTCVGRIFRYFEYRGDDEFDCVVYDDGYDGRDWHDREGRDRCTVIQGYDVRGSRSALWHDEENRPDFGACADKIEAAPDWRLVRL